MVPTVDTIVEDLGDCYKDVRVVLDEAQRGVRAGKPGKPATDGEATDVGESADAEK